MKKKVVILVILCVALLTSACQGSNAAGTVDPTIFDVRASALPEGWDAAMLIQQTDAQACYERSARTIQERYGYTASIDWTQYVVAYRVTYDRLDELQGLSDCEAAFDNPALIFPIYAEINGQQRIAGRVYIAQRSGEFYSDSAVTNIDDTFVSGESHYFLEPLDMENDFAAPMDMLDKEDIDVLVFALVERKTGAVLLAHSRSDGWTVYDYDNRAQFPEGEKKAVLPLEAFIAQRQAYEKMVRRVNMEPWIWPAVGCAAVTLIAVCIVVVCLRRYRKYR